MSMQDIDVIIQPQVIVHVVQLVLYAFQMVFVNKQMEMFKII